MVSLLLPIIDGAAVFFRYFDKLTSSLCLFTITKRLFLAKVARNLKKHLLKKKMFRSTKLIRYKFLIFIHGVEIFIFRPL